MSAALSACRNSSWVRACRPPIEGYPILISMPRFKLRLASECRNECAKAAAMTAPKIATANTPATRATALLIPEAVRALSCSTEFITTVVNGGTLMY